MGVKSNQSKAIVAIDFLKGLQPSQEIIVRVKVNENGHEFIYDYPTHHGDVERWCKKNYTTKIFYAHSVEVISKTNEPALRPNTVIGII